MSERDRTILHGPGIAPSRERYVKVGECVACGVTSTDFVLYDGGPKLAKRALGNVLASERYRFALCVRVERNARHWLAHPDEPPTGCAVDYAAWQEKKLAAGDLQGATHYFQLLRRFIRERRPSVVFPDEVLV